MKACTNPIRLLESLGIPEGPAAVHAVKLATFQKQFFKAALADVIDVSCLKF